MLSATMIPNGKVNTMRNLMTEYENYEEWKKAREAVRDTLHVYSEWGDDIPDEEMCSNFGNVWAIRVDDDAALDFVYEWHGSFELLDSKYRKVRGDSFLVLGTTYVYLNDSLGWVNLSEMSRTVAEMQKRFRVA